MPRSLRSQAHDLQRVMAGLVSKYQFRDRNETSCHGLSVSQAYALRALAERGVQPMNALAGSLRLSLSAMTRVIDPLEERGLVRRMRDARDRRVCRVALTTPGEALWQRIEDELVASNADVLRELSVSERELVIRVMGQLSEAVDVWRVGQAPVATSSEAAA